MEIVVEEAEAVETVVVCFAQSLQHHILMQSGYRGDRPPRSYGDDAGGGMFYPLPRVSNAYDCRRIS